MTYQVLISDKERGWLPYSRICRTRSGVYRIMQQFERKMPHRMFKAIKTGTGEDIHKGQKEEEET